MPLNTELRNIRSEGGDVRFEEVDLDAERGKRHDASMEASIAVDKLAAEYGEIADEANRLLETYGQHPDLTVSLSGLSEIMQAAAHANIELKGRLVSGASAETILRGKTVDQLKDDHEYSLEGMRERLKKMKAVTEALDRHDRLEDARDDVDELQTASAIVQERMFEDKADAQKEREAALEAAQRKLDLRALAKLLGDVKTSIPTIVEEDISGVNKLLEGDGKETFKATFDITSSMSETADRLAARLKGEIEKFMDAGVDAQEIKQLVSNLQLLSENAKKRANEASNTNRGVSKRKLGMLKERVDQLEDAKLLFSPDNAVGTIARGGKSVDAAKHLDRLRKK